MTVQGRTHRFWMGSCASTPSPQTTRTRFEQYWSGRGRWGKWTCQPDPAYDLGALGHSINYPCPQLEPVLFRAVIMDRLK